MPKLNTHKGVPAYYMTAEPIDVQRRLAGTTILWRGMPVQVIDLITEVTPTKHTVTGLSCVVWGSSTVTPRAIAINDPDLDVLSLPSRFGWVQLTPTKLVFPVRYPQRNSTQGVNYNNFGIIGAGLFGPSRSDAPGQTLLGRISAGRSLLFDEGADGTSAAQKQHAQMFSKISGMTKISYGMFELFSAAHIRNMIANLYDPGEEQWLDMVRLPPVSMECRALSRRYFMHRDGFQQCYIGDMENKHVGLVNDGKVIYHKDYTFLKEDVERQTGLQPA